MMKQVSSLLQRLAPHRAIRDNSEERNGNSRNANASRAPNEFYNDLQIIDIEKTVSSVTVVDDKRIAVAVDSGDVIIYDISFGKKLKTFKGLHKKPAKFIHVVSPVPYKEAKDGFTKTQIITVSDSGDANNFIILWDVDNNSMESVKEGESASHLRKCLMVDEIPSATLVLRRTSADIPIRIISALNKAVIHELNETRSSLQVDHSEVALDRTESSREIIDIAETDTYIICLSNDIVDVYAKEYKDKHLHLNREKKMCYLPYFHDMALTKTCIMVLNGDIVALGTERHGNGDVYVIDLTNIESKECVLQSAILDRPVKSLQPLNEAWICALCDKTIQLINFPGHKVERPDVMRLITVLWDDKCALHSATIVRERNQIVALPENSLTAGVWTVGLDKKSNLDSLRYCDEIIGHDGHIKAVNALSDGSLLTNGGDTLVIIWRNRDEETHRLFTEVMSRNDA